MAGRSGGSMLGIGWENIRRVRRETEKTKIALTNLNKTFLYWMEEDEGGTLTKKAANELSKYLKEQILAQRFGGGALSKHIPVLSDWWTKEKEARGLDQRIGIATQQMVNAIRPIDMGKGNWRVGISKNDPLMQKIGSADTIAEYALYLEFGTKTQPPRPLFATIFLKWIYDEAPKFIADTIYKDMRPILLELYKRAGENRPNIQAEDLFGHSAAGEGGEQEITTGKSAEDIAIERQQAESPEPTEYDYEEEERPDYEVTWYEESERTENYVSQQLSGAVLHMTEASGDIWNWIDNVWQDSATAMERLQMYGAL